MKENPLLKTLFIHVLAASRDPEYSRITRHINSGSPGFSQADLDRLWSLGIHEFVPEYIRMLDGEERSR